MNIALIADEQKKELLVQFCAAYCGILAKNKLYATDTVGRLITEATGLKPEILISSNEDAIGQLSAKISCNEIDSVIYLRSNDLCDTDPDAYTNDMLRTCDSFNIPVATNISTAELIIKAIERGDLDWREILNPYSEYNLRKGRFKRAK